MAFFNDLGKKFVQLGQTTAQKTKEFGDIAKINALISEEEKKIEDNIYQIGVVYFKLHHEDYEVEFKELINSIEKSSKTIFEAKQQLNLLKGVNHCEKCGAEIKSNMAFCSSCGNKINIVSNYIKCSGCGAMVAKDMKFCTSCGKPMTPSGEFTESNGGVETMQQPPNFKICSSCGEKVSCDETFCTECGNKL